MPTLTPEAKALVGKKVFVTRTTPDKTYIIALPGVDVIPPDKLFRGTILEYKIDESKPMTAKMTMYVKIRVDRETQERWGLDDPILEWEDTRADLPIYETVPRRDFAKGLAQVNAKKAHLPIELLGEIMRYEVPNARPGPHPGSKYAGTRRKKKLRGTAKRKRFT
jgi:hypothetical protein